MRESVLLAVGAVVAVVLQIVLAPNVAILGAMPNFALVYMATSAMLAKRDMVVVVAFCCGLALDLIGTYTVGVYAGLFVVAAFAAMRSAAFFGSDTLGATFVTRPFSRRARRGAFRPPRSRRAMDSGGLPTAWALKTTSRFASIEASNRRSLA